MIDQYINLKETKVMFKKWLSLFLVGFIFLAGCSNANTEKKGLQKLVIKQLSHSGIQ